MKKIILLMALLALSPLSACATQSSGFDPDLSGRPIRVVTTIGMITDMVENIGGERVVVEGLMGPGVDPHLYKASEGDVQRLAEADVVFYNGLHLEAAMADLFDQMQTLTASAPVTANIDREALLAPPEFEGAYDPHVWFDVLLWVKSAEQVQEVLSDLDPDHAEIYRSNAETYIEQLIELDNYVKEQAERVPERQRVLITAHDAFNYFGRAYGFTVRGLQGISTAAEAGTADVQELADFIADRKIPAIFVESSVPPRSIQAVQAAVEARGFKVRIGGELYSDAMGTAGTSAGTYIGMVRHNIDTIVNALLGE